MSTFPLDDRDPISQDVLAAYGFDEAEFEMLRAGVADGSRSAMANVVDGAISALRASEVTSLPRLGEPVHAEALEAGHAALRAGEFAYVVLNGGMATRFGGMVKGTVEAVDGMTFLEVKLAQVLDLGRNLETQVPVVLMTSWLTEGPTRHLLARCDLPTPLCFSQSVSLRLQQDGELFRTADGRASLCTVGHGDFLMTFRASGTLSALRSQGVRHIMVSNVDNLAARPDPLVLGTHIVSGRSATLEVVDRSLVGAGAPVLVGDRLRFLESVQLPPSLDRSAFPANTNTITFRIDDLDRLFEPTWLYVEKLVEGRKAVQLEHAFAAGCDVLPTTILQVPSDGWDGRFLPIKTPTDLIAAQPALRRLVTTSGAA
jgi:UTP--glucose-1-phosphate uridylyltransferase